MTTVNFKFARQDGADEADGHVLFRQIDKGVSAGTVHSYRQWEDTDGNGEGSIDLDAGTYDVRVFRGTALLIHGEAEIPDQDSIYLHDYWRRTLSVQHLIEDDTMADLITFTRSSKAWAFDSAGLLKEFAVDAQRFEYDPVTNAIKGLLIEEQRTNSLLDNRDLSTGNWSNTGPPGLSQNHTGVDGVANTAWTLTDDNSGIVERVSQDITIPDDSNTHVISCFWNKDGGSETPTISVDFLGGTTTFSERVSISKLDGTITVLTSGATAHVQNVGDWWRVELRVTNNSTGNTTFRVNLLPVGIGAANTGSSIYDFGQVELDANFASSPIETAGSAVTRSADDVTSTIGGEFNADEFSYVIEGAGPATEGSSNSVLFVLHDGSNNNTVQITRIGSSKSLQLDVRSGGVSQASLSPGTLNNGQSFKLAIRIKADDFAASLNGGSISSDASGSMPSGLTKRFVGQNISKTGKWNSHIELIREIPRALTDTELQTQSTL